MPSFSRDFQGPICYFFLLLLVDSSTTTSQPIPPRKYMHMCRPIGVRGLVPLDAPRRYRGRCQELRGISGHD
jgi:hypothetical protein